VGTGCNGSPLRLCFGTENEHLEVGVTSVEFGQQIGRRQVRKLTVKEHSVRTNNLQAGQQFKVVFWLTHDANVRLLAQQQPKSGAHLSLSNGDQ
jgi:hypothetical protein